MTKEEFLNEMDWFTEYYDFKMNKKMLEIWFKLSQKSCADKLNKALLQHIENDDSPFFPSFGKIAKAFFSVNNTRINSTGNYCP